MSWMGRGSKTFGGEIFRTRPQRTRGAHSFFPGVKQSGRGVDDPTPSSAEVEERVQLYVQPPSRAVITCYRENLPLSSYFLPLSSYFFKINFKIMAHVVYFM